MLQLRVIVGVIRLQYLKVLSAVKIVIAAAKTAKNVSAINPATKKNAKRKKNVVKNVLADAKTVKDANAKKNVIKQNAIKRNLY